MIARRAATASVLALALCLGAAGARGVGLDLGGEILAVDVAGAYAEVPAALAGSFDALLSLLADEGIPPGELAGLEAELDATVADITGALDELPGFLPVPLVALGIELPVSLVVVDAVRVSGGLLRDAWVRGIASAAGVVVPTPLVDRTFDLGGDPARFAVDASFAAWSLALDAVKRLDLWIAALSLSAGMGYAAGGATVTVEREVPSSWEPAVDEALAALHLDDLRWAAWSTRLGARLELGLPFLRVFAEVRLVQPLVAWVGEWDLVAAGWAGTIGVVIRF